MGLSRIIIFIIGLIIASTSAQTLKGDATFYNLGLTACGKTFSNNDLVAATAFDWWSSPNPNNDKMCGKRARVTDPTSGKSVTVQIWDKCSGCKHGDIDLSPAAFSRLRNQAVGRFKVTWSFI